MPVFYISEYRESQFDAHDFVVQKGNSTANQHVEGHLTYWRYDFIPPAGALPVGSRPSATTRTPCSGWAARRCTTRPGKQLDSTFLISRNGADTWIDFIPEAEAI